MISSIGDKIWVVDQSQKYHGIEIGARMTVIKIKGSRLVLISPVEITESMANEMSLLGEVAFIVAPNLYHHLYLNSCVQRYPNARVLIAQGLQKKHPDLLQAEVLSNKVVAEWGDEMDQQELHGYSVLEVTGPVVLNEVVFFHKVSKTLIMADGAYHFGDSAPLSIKLFAKLTGFFKVLGPTPLEKFATKEKQKLKNALNRIMDWPFESVVMAHGDLISNGGRDKLRKGYGWLLDCA